MNSLIIEKMKEILWDDFLKVLKNIFFKDNKKVNCKSNKKSKLIFYVLQKFKVRLDMS